MESGTRSKKSLGVHLGGRESKQHTWAWESGLDLNYELATFLSLCLRTCYYLQLSFLFYKTDYLQG